MMTNLIRRAYISMNTLKYKIKNDECGVGPLVATILILLVVVLMAVAFQDQLSTWFNKMTNKIFNENEIQDDFNH